MNRSPGALVLAVGIVALEFAAAVSSFVSSTLLPVVTRDLHARDELALLVAGSTLGMFVALPLASRIVHALGTSGTPTAGIVAYVGGLIVAATSTHAWVFALGQFSGGLASGLLAVFGVSSAIRQLDDALRIRVVAASSAMWILPALVGPAATLGLDHLVGWRWTLLVPVPVVLVGRVLVVRAADPDPKERRPHRPLGRTLLIPLGVSGIVFGGAWWPLPVVGTSIALVGVATLLPAGTARLVRGTQAAVAALLLFAAGYFGADSLITVLLTDGYRTSLADAAVVLSGAPLAWALTGVIVPRFLRSQGMARLPTIGLVLSAVGVAVVGGALVVAPLFGVVLGAWTIAGIGVGLAYPGLYLRATTTGSSGFGPAELAAAAITAESFGGLIGRSAGGALSSVAGTAGLVVCYLLFAVFVAGAALAAMRATPTDR